MTEPLRVVVVGPDGTPATVSREGTLAVGGLPSEPIFQELDAINTAFKFFAPLPGIEYCITQIVISTNKDVGVDGATIDIYEGETETTTTIARSLYRLKLLKNAFAPIMPMFISVNPERWILAKTDDDVVEITIAVFQVPART